MTVLGIDPGLATVGFGLIDSRRGVLTHIAHGVIRTKPGPSLAQRLCVISGDLRELLERYKPEAMAVEELYFGHNVTTALAVAHARGVILCTAACFGLEAAVYTPNQVKMSVTGYGAAEKKQIMEMTARILKLGGLPKPDDAADALAIAVCHAHSRGF